MLKTEEKKELQELIEIKLTEAESIWNKVRPEMILEKASDRASNFAAMEDLETQIPGYPLISIDKPEVDDFIAIVVDMRDSTKHLLEAISYKRAKVSQLQRVFYETSALLPVLAKTISYESGKVTEYLGDGVLGLFHAPHAKRPKCIYGAHNASKKCLCAIDEVVNLALLNRYNLPPLKIGIGLAFSKAVVTMTGIEKHYQPKVFGECVYRATKISGGTNKIYVDEALYRLWPTQKNGILRFRPTRIKDVDAYMIDKAV